MKKVAPAIALVMVLSVFLMAFTVPAANTPAGPTATAVSGDMDFTVSVVAPSTLSGAVVAPEQPVYPVGYADGSLQFIGKALILSDFNGGAVSVCFPFSEYDFGWRGAVYGWSGSQWQSISTTFTEGEEGVATKACATVYGNGTYALLAYYNTADAPKKQAEIIVPDCIMDVSLNGYGYDGPDGGTLRLLLSFPGITDGVSYNWEVTSASPAGAMTDLPASGSYLVTFGFIVTSDMPYDRYPTYLIVKIFDEGTCHAGVLRPDFHAD